MEWDGGTKSIIQCSSYSVSICMFISTLYIYSRKFSPTFLWVSKFDVKLRVGEHQFENYPTCVSLEIFISKHVLLFLVLNRIRPFFLKISEYFLPWKIEKIWLQTCNLILLIVDSSFFFILKSATRGRKVPDALSIKKKMGCSHAKHATRGREAPYAKRIFKIRGFR